MVKTIHEGKARSEYTYDFVTPPPARAVVNTRPIIVMPKSMPSIESEDDRDKTIGQGA